MYSIMGFASKPALEIKSISQNRNFIEKEQVSKTYQAYFLYDFVQIGELLIIIVQGFSHAGWTVYGWVWGLWCCYFSQVSGKYNPLHISDYKTCHNIICIFGSEEMHSAV